MSVQLLVYIFILLYSSQTGHREAHVYSSLGNSQQTGVYIYYILFDRGIWIALGEGPFGNNIMVMIYLATIHFSPLPTYRMFIF